jgi:hypothetical protein
MVGAARAVCLSSCLIAWLIGLAFGFAQLANYGAEPGDRGEVALTMPVTAQITPASDRPTLVMFIHPKCPCSRASLGELSELLARHRDRFQCVLVFIHPETCSDEWVKSDLWDQAQSFSEVQTVIDRGCQLAKRYGVRTSGETLLYLSNGCLVFRGGITYARGHAGDNLGIESIERCMSDIPEQLLETPVFGCPLFSEPQEGQGTCCET